MNSDSLKQPVYVSRKVLNGKELWNWASSVGFGDLIGPEDMHVTVTFSKTPVPINSFAPSAIETTSGTLVGQPIKIHAALGLRIDCPDVQESHQKHLGMGATFDYGDGIFRPHISIKYDPTEEDLERALKVQPFQGAINLSREEMEPLILGWRPGTQSSGE
ncbi:MAG: hypothetical protein KUG69_09070 [Marinosulfonomonas sp.]|nr:hypothetical protein [Marinosulfonomonas sp.]